MPRLGGPRDELPGPSLPAAWRALLVPSLARGATQGVIVGLTLLPVAVLLEAKRAAGGAPWRLGPLVGAVVFGLLVGLVGGAPAAALEALGRSHPERRLLTAVACGAAVGLASLGLLLQAIYLGGSLHGGFDAGIDKLARVVSAIRTNPAMALGVTGGALLALSLPVTHVVALRLAGRGAGAQVGLGLALALGEGMALLAVMGCGAAAMGGKFDEIVLRAPVRATVLAAMVTAGMGLLAAGGPLALLLPFALRAADRIGGRWDPPPDDTDGSVRSAPGPG